MLKISEKSELNLHFWHSINSSCKFIFQWLHKFNEYEALAVFQRLVKLCKSLAAHYWAIVNTHSRTNVGQTFKVIAKDSESERNISWTASQTLVKRKKFKKLSENSHAHFITKMFFIFTNNFQQWNDATYSIENNVSTTRKLACLEIIVLHQGAL